MKYPTALNLYLHRTKHHPRESRKLINYTLKDIIIGSFLFYIVIPVAIFAIISQPLGIKKKYKSKKEYIDEWGHD